MTNSVDNVLYEGPSVTVILASVSPKRIGDVVAPKNKHEGQITNKSNLHNHYKTSLGEMLLLREDLRGMKMGYPLCFPVCQEFIRWLCPDFAQIIIIINFFLISSSFLRKSLPPCNRDELLVIKAF